MDDGRQLPTYAVFQAADHSKIPRGIMQGVGVEDSMPCIVMENCNDIYVRPQKWLIHSLRCRGEWPLA